MEGVKMEEINYTDHDRKCRICFKAFGADEHRVEVSKLIEKKFRELTQTIVNLFLYLLDFKFLLKVFFS